MWKGMYKLDLWDICFEIGNKENIYLYNYRDKNTVWDG